MTDDDKSYPTAEFRQIKRPITRGNGVCGPGHHEEITGYDVTVQQKWMVKRKGKLRHMGEFEMEREEWKDIPIVWDHGL